MDYQVRIKQQDRRSMVMRVTTDGLLVLIPRWLKPSSSQVKEFIAAGLKRLEGRIPLLPIQQSTPEDLRTMLEQWAVHIGVTPKRIQMRSMYRKWGSCSKTGNITLNQALCYVPPHLAEYVICHELVHMREFNHGKEFKSLMNQYMPDWQQRDKELDAYLILRPGKRKAS